MKRTSPEVKCLHLTSSRREMCTLSVSNMIYHKFSHGAAFYTLSGKNVNVMLEFLFLCKHCLVLFSLFPTNTIIRYGCLNFRVVKFPGLGYSHHMPKYFSFPLNHWHNILNLLVPLQEPFKLCMMRVIRFQSNSKQIDFKCIFKSKPSLLCLG